LPLRKLIFWTHLTAGVIAGLVILTMSLTGVLLAFQRQVLSWADRDLRATAAEARRTPLAVSLVAAASKASPDAKPSNVTLRSDPRAPAAITFGRERTLFVNRYTGAVLGEGAKGARRFFRFNGPPAINPRVRKTTSNSPNSTRSRAKSARSSWPPSHAARCSAPPRCPCTSFRRCSIVIQAASPSARTSTTPYGASRAR
jgi:hypothetical protein